MTLMNADSCNKATDILESDLAVNSKEVAVTASGYIAKNLLNVLNALYVM